MGGVTGIIHRMRGAAARLLRPLLQPLLPPWRDGRTPYFIVAALLVFAAFNLFWFLTYVPPVAQGLDAIRSSGRLVVLTRSAPTAYYIGSDGPSGFEYETTQAFARALGVRVEYRTCDTEPELLAALAARKGHIAAAGLAATPERRQQFVPLFDYQPVRQLLVCRRGVRRPGKLDDLAGLKVVVADGTAGAAAIAAGAANVKGLVAGHAREGVETLLEVAARGQIDCTVANTHEFRVNNPYYPELVEAFALTGEQPLAWFAAPDSQDVARFAKDWAAGAGKAEFFADMGRRFFGFLPAFDYVDIRAFQAAIESKLPDYEKAMRAAARESGLPWQLLAAIAYQESHWEPDARSHTGVRGIMMLTEDTADHLGVDDRLNPVESLYAGARYIADLRARIPDAVREPDRLWFALAAYNMGLGHLADARQLAASQGLNRDLWSDLRKVLPLMQRQEYAPVLKYGPAKGGQALRFVQQVRAYQHILEARRP